MSAAKEKAPARQRQGFGVNHYEAIHMADITAVQAGTQQLVRVFDGQIGGALAQVCDGRELHAFLKNGKQFSDWIKQRITQYGFEENTDFSIVSVKSETIRKYANGERKGVSKVTDYHLTLDMAKELSMVENNEQGRKARRYFIDCEKRANAPASPVVVADACSQVAFEGCRIRVWMRDGKPWFAAANVATALGLPSSDRITRSAHPNDVCRTMKGKQATNYMSQQLARRAADYAKPELGERWLVWLQRTLAELAGQPVNSPAPQADPASLLRALLAGNRFICCLDEMGRITMREIPPSAVLANVERLPEWIADPAGPPAHVLPGILAAVADRMRCPV